MSVKSVLSSTAVLVVGAVALTGCRSGSAASADGSAPPQRPPASSAPALPSSSKPSAVTPSAVKPTSARPTSPPATENGSSSGGSSGGRTAGKGKPAGKSSPSSRPVRRPSSEATSDSYAWKHPCTPGQLSVRVVRRASAPTERVIEVRNLGPDSCGLSYYPLTSLTAHAGGGQAVEPLVPSGLGGAPAYPVYAGQTAYAVIDLDPSGATSGTVPGIDQLNVLADGDHMPKADTLGFPLGTGAGARVHGPKLGLYRSTVADAIVSMRSADILP
ncbi:hypothetical protein GA0115240_142129 [Streptomyces sp. DvalAA-14]|uniref:DUF4232 domain-containing protein n=1 Tax=unclassified Streptomyces TaxID=2593676 RepID=UPI00081AEEE9|nr:MULTISPECIES: DUF4232 domain-containing protein [unclassified Streptomyces]MYS22476.1 hypothetical protein [Streptomyces sp. SID4948]SCE16985.1 hypothetical protein GA0115240_142129 [Streptomyces sp. DvalAA-14]